jgi:hypothetical protein
MEVTILCLELGSNYKTLGLVMDGDDYDKGLPPTLCLTIDFVYITV